MKATWNGVTLAESDDTVVVEGNHYFPEASLKREYVTFSNHRTSCHWKGQAYYYSLFVNGDKDTVTSPEAVHSLVSKLKTQKGIAVEHKVIAGANHFFQDKIDELTKICSTYLDKRLASEGQM